MEKELLDAIRKLNETIADLSRSLGRGVSSTGGVNRGGGGVEDAITGSSVLAKTLKNLSVIKRTEFNQIVRSISMNQKLTASQNKFLKEINSSVDEVKQFAAATQDATDGQKKAAKLQKEATEDLVASMSGFGAGLLTGTRDIENLMGGLGASLGRQAKLAKENGLANAGLVDMLAKLAASVAFTLTAMGNFAKNAQEMSGMVDLARVRVGFLTEARLFSALDKSFVKVINESQGAFRTFGSSTQEAIDNLSNLSRGLRLGSGSARSSTREMAKDFDRAAAATAALGLTQDEQASLQATIMTQVRLRARNEREAQQMLVKQYADTASSARNLSNQFGLSAKEVAKSMQDFMASTSGQIASLKGVQGAAEVKEMLKLAVPGLSEDMANRMALDIARGNIGAAKAAGPSESANMIEIVGQAAMRAQQAGGITDKTLTEAMRGQRGAIQTEYERYSDLYASGSTGALFDVSAAAGNLGKRLDESEKQRDEREKKAGKTEADNVKSMSTLSAALDSLRGSVNVLIGTILAVLGPIGLILGGILAQMAAGKLFGAITGAAGVAGGAAAGTGIFNTIKGLFTEKIIPAVSTGFSAVFGVMQSLLGPAIGGIQSVLLSAFGAVKSLITGTLIPALGSIQPLLSSVFGAVKTLFTDTLFPSMSKFGQGMGALATKVLPSFASGLQGVLGKLGGAKGILGTLAVVAGGAAIADTIAGAAGVGGKTINEQQDQANWERMGVLQKMQSGLARGIESIGSALFMGNMANEARAKRIQSETEFLAKSSNLSPTANVSTPSMMADLPSSMIDFDKLIKEQSKDLIRGTPDNRSSADMGQIMGYLSSISSDIAAIRSNTRGESVTAPVRLG